MRSLVDLLSPYPLHQFWKTNWTQQAVVISGDDSTRFATLFSWERLSYLLNFYPLKYPDLRCVLMGQVFAEAMHNDLAALCQQGATLIINEVHKFCPELATVAAALRAEFGCGTQINAYASYPGKQGFNCHYDTHDVFILQIAGCKQWHVFPDTFKYPLVDQKSADQTPPLGEPYLTPVLEPGDVLYIPRGHWHDAIAQTEPTLHLTVGIHNRTGISLLEWLVDELRQQEQWRASLPRHSDADQFNAQIQALTAQLSQTVLNPSLGERYGQYLDRRNRPIARYAFPSQAGFQIFPSGVQTRFWRSPWQSLQASAQADGYCLLTADKSVTLRGVPATFINNLVTQQTFSAHDVTTWLIDFDWDTEVAPLLSRLVMEGVIFVETSP
jgi:hypothetical protein